jgi:hypothetical protein
MSEGEVLGFLFGVYFSSWAAGYVFGLKLLMFRKASEAI